MNVPVRVPGEPAPVGDNAPPTDPTPFDLSAREIEDLFVEGKNWCDGTAIGTQDEADAVARLLKLTKAAIALADQRREIEARPFDDGKAEVQNRYNQIIGKTKGVTGRGVVLQKALEAVLGPWRERIAREHRAAIEAARIEAERNDREAKLALQMSDRADLGGREEAEALNQAAKASQAAFRKLAKPKPTGLRVHTIATVEDRRAFLNWIAANRPEDLTEWLQIMAQRISDAKERGLPGVTYRDEARAI